MQNINSTQDYTSLEQPYQLVLPLNVEFQIPKDDPVRLVRYCIGGMDLSALYQNCHHVNRNQASPAQMLAVLSYAYANSIFSTRKIEEACRSNIKFMYLLEGKPAPDHATISRFITKRLRPCIREIFTQMGKFLEKIGAVSRQDIFIDGTKIESFANKYKFVWKKAVEKHKDKILAKLPAFCTRAEADLGIRVPHGETIRLHHLKNLRRKLRRKILEDGIAFVYGSGKWKTPLQRTFEELDGYIVRLKHYIAELHEMRGRNSFAKTDKDATFMRMKEDAMKNGQLKPAYNVQYGSDSEFILWASVGPQTTDTNTLVPFLREFEQSYGTCCENVVADAGYESEENYTYLEDHGMKSFIKPINYEKSKTRKWKNDIGRFENMTYLPDEDAYLCANGRKLHIERTYQSKTKTGYRSEKTCYACEDCRDCPMKADCIHGNHFKKPMEERTKRLIVSKKFLRQRKEDLARITSEEGVELRVNRSIQAEGAFADIKADMGFRRFLGRGTENALVAVILLAMAHNVQKLHHKIQNGMVGRHRIPVNQAA